MSSHHYKSVLPDNSSPFMRAVETAFRSQLEQVCEPYPNLLRANLTPRQFLAALAGESGVTDWFETDTDDEQRAIAGRGLVIQKSAGTRKGLKIAAESIGLDAVVTPWFKMDGEQPYQIFIEAYASEKPLDASTLARLDARILNHKSERDIVNINIARTSSATPFVGVTCEIGTTITSQPFVSGGSESLASIVIGAFNHLRIISTSEPAIQ